MIKAIDTFYKGYKFRSRLEARWAVYFDSIGIEWEYEIEGFEFKDGTKYLPDFWLPQVNMWAEVKAKELNKKESDKVRKLAETTQHEVLILIGMPKEEAYEVINTNGLYDYNCVLSGYHNYLNNESRFYASPSNADWESGCFDDIPIAINKSKSARFEFGENGE